MRKRTDCPQKGGLIVIFFIRGGGKDHQEGKRVASSYKKKEERGGGGLNRKKTKAIKAQRGVNCKLKGEREVPWRLQLKKEKGSVNRVTQQNQPPYPARQNHAEIQTLSSKGREKSPFLERGGGSTEKKKGQDSCLKKKKGTLPPKKRIGAGTNTLTCLN